MSDTQSATRERSRAAMTERVRRSLAGLDRVELLAPDISAPVVADRHVSRDYYMRRLLVAADVMALLLGLVVTAIATGPFHLASHGLWALLTIPVWLLLMNVYGLYSNDARRISHSGADELPGLFHTILIGTSAMWAYYQLAPTTKVEFWTMLTFATAAGVCLVTLRASVRSAVNRLFCPERVLFVGSGRSTAPLAMRMRDRPSLGLEPVGIVTDAASAAAPAGLESLGELEDTDIASLIATHRIDRVIVEAAGFADEVVLVLLKRCKQLSVKVSLLPAAFGVLGTSVAVDHVGGITLLGVNPPVLPRSARAMKRGMDVVGALILMTLFAPVFVAVALAIRIDSKGPTLFRQRRVGKSGAEFQIFKFRTMVVDAEAQRGELQKLSRDPNWLLLENDPRATRVGRFLRSTSLDEIPQLLNVLTGDMSLVGPRPLVPEEDGQVGEWARTRLDLTPGMTGLWQVLGRTTIPFDEMVKLDYLYVTNWSLWGDVKLVLHTFPVVLARRGAN